MQSGRDSLRIHFYFSSVDLILTALNDRFNTHSSLPLLKCMSCLENPIVDKADEVIQLATFYTGEVSTVSLKEEYNMMVRLLQKERVVPSGMHDIYKWLLKNGLSHLCISVTELYKLSITLPATSCSNERSFSALKFVKNRLRTTMSQDRLEDLMILAVEAERTQSLDLARVHDLFWNSVERR